MQSTNFGRPVLKSITPNKLLSFGGDSNPIDLKNLNIIIGPNGSGKSNLIEVINLLRSSPLDMRSVIRKGGGIREWIWKGESNAVASIDAVIDNPKGQQPLRHIISFHEDNQKFCLDDESIANEHSYLGDNTKPYFFYSYNKGAPLVKKFENDPERQLTEETVEKDISILSQRRDPDNYPVISYLSTVYAQIRIYREWTFGRNAVFREPQKADMRNDILEEDFSNLGLFLNRLERIPKVKKAILEGLRDFYEGFDDFGISIEGGTVQVFFTEGNYSIPATRLSDGTLRYLCLLAILCDPKPPSLICIEEPELGLHPDIIPRIADLFKEASHRTQLIVTTHSDILVDAMTDQPESLIVCEKHSGKTIMKHLDPAGIGNWVEKYRLGELWTRGELGGTRW
ncbi:AAA family ATPase [Methanoregula sp.]|uniref:AAA family ATPase n=1 Tax=Methanoregula sp. TaxID=2052170 RepID=UPI00356A928A